ncbi:hypothetical protein ACOMHN_028357 [Nucella lapillus]
MGKGHQPDAVDGVSLNQTPSMTSVSTRAGDDVNIHQETIFTQQSTQEVISVVSDVSSNVYVMSVASDVSSNVYVMSVVRDVSSNVCGECCVQ